MHLALAIILGFLAWLLLTEPLQEAYHWIGGVSAFLAILLFLSFIEETLL